MTQVRAMIVGASSLLSREIATQLAADGVRLTLFASDPQSLREFSQSLPTQADIFPLHVDDPQAIITSIKTAWQSLGGADLVLVNTGLHHYDPELPWQAEQQMITVNVQAFSAICNTAFQLFRTQGYGQLTTINSIAGLRGGSCVAYHASKAYAKNYVEGLSMHAQRLKLPITLTDIQLGLLDKAVLQKNRLWVAPPDKIARQIINAMKAGKRKVYVTKRWRWVAWLTQCLPEFIYNTRQWQTKAQRKAQKKNSRSVIKE
ncbi:SDR family NAD(P)-dependent oxidoreductase [Shewanella sp.]|nr:SDR family NAD(P)-dependent oxidoreductase [Shewanella sp.]